ncbi:PREDICTED: uncharacterized protein LOC106746097 isoform X2 [Dinoponera quadriceps]|nr:PREDICTED: uncharacterized protein LOC106746097 isoform X2 [Dinoponera quadriceps]
MSLPYAVVQFPKEGTYSEIPTSWLTKDFTQCRWPTTKNVTFFLKKNNPPKADWLLCDVKVECYCNTLEQARRKAKGANYLTSYEENRGRGKRVVHEKKYDDTYDTCDNDSRLRKTAHKKLKIDKNWDSSSDSSSGKMSLCDKQLSREKLSSCERVSQVAVKGSFSTPNSSLCDKSQLRKGDPLQMDELNNINEPLTFEPMEVNVPNLNVITTDSPLATVGDIEKLISICKETLECVKSVDKRLGALEKRICETEDPTINMFDGILPINSMEDLIKFEESLETIETRMNFVEFMKKIGGKDNRSTVQRCMSRLFTNEFGIACSWCGRGNNYRMCDLKCMRVLKGILRTKGIDECDVEIVASEWFRLSRLRYDRENKKNCSHTVASDVRQVKVPEDT